MGWVTDWDEALYCDIEELEIDEFSATIKSMSEWMDLEVDPVTVVGILRQVVWADMEVPVVLGSHGEVIQGLPQLLRAYLEGHEVVRTVRLSPTPPGCWTPYVQ